jgi:serine protease AprX
MATPVVSGAVALLPHKDPRLTPDQVKARLMKTATKSFPANSIATDPSTGESFVSYYDLFTVGAGYLDIGAALANNDLASTKHQALSPRAVLVTAKNGTTSVQISYSSSVMWGTSVVWGTSSTWSNSVMWGTSVLSGSSVVWGTSVCWGTSTSDAFSVLWGTTSPYSNSVLWGDSVQATGLMIYGDK